MTRWLSCLLGGWCFVAGCVESDEAVLPDATVQVHKALPATPSAAGLAYAKTLAGVHERADEAESRGASPSELASVLRDGVELAIPEPLRAGDNRLESDIGVLRLELLARYCEHLVKVPDAAPEVQRLLEPVVASRRSLPLDRATGRALVVLGHAAYENGDDAMAVASYARAIRVMTMLQQELVQ